MTISGLTRGRLVGEDQVAKLDYPRLCRTLRPAPQAGCFVSRLVPPKTQRKSLCAIEHSAPWPERRQARWRNGRQPLVLFAQGRSYNGFRRCGQTTGKSPEAVQRPPERQNVSFDRSAAA